MSPFSCQAKRGIKYFPSREASQQRGERASRKEKAGGSQAAVARERKTGKRSLLIKSLERFPSNFVLCLSLRRPVTLFSFFYLSPTFCILRFSSVEDTFSPVVDRGGWLGCVTAVKSEPKLGDLVWTSHAKCRHASGRAVCNLVPAIVSSWRSRGCRHGSSLQRRIYSEMYRGNEKCCGN